MKPDFHRLVKQTLLLRYPEREANALSRILLEDVGGLSLQDILIHGADNTLSAEVQSQISSMAERIVEGEPWQYVVGRTDFCGLTIGVKQGVLIPRPETAEMVERILRGETLTPSCRLLDIGTGSGCIALALKQSLPQAYVEAWDASPAALSVARKNAEQLDLEISFKPRDVLKCVSEEREYTDGFDLLVSNPPYVCRSEAADMDALVLDHEPHLALFVPDENPLLFYSAIASLGQRLLKRGGLLWFEINQRFGTEVCQLLRQDGYAEVTLHTDSYGNDRFVRALWEGNYNLTNQ